MSESSLLEKVLDNYCITKSLLKYLDPRDIANCYMVNKKCKESLRQFLFTKDGKPNLLCNWVSPSAPKRRQISLPDSLRGRQDIQFDDYFKWLYYCNGGKIIIYDRKTLSKIRILKRLDRIFDSMLLITRSYLIVKNEINGHIFFKKADFARRTVPMKYFPNAFSSPMLYFTDQSDDIILTVGEIQEELTAWKIKLTWSDYDSPVEQLWIHSPKHHLIVSPPNQSLVAVVDVTYIGTNNQQIGLHVLDVNTGLKFHSNEFTSNLVKSFRNEFAVYQAFLEYPYLILSLARTMASTQDHSASELRIVIWDVSKGNILKEFRTEALLERFNLQKPLLHCNNVGVLTLHLTFPQRIFVWDLLELLDPKETCSWTIQPHRIFNIKSYQGHSPTINDERFLFTLDLKNKKLISLDFWDVLDIHSQN